jgi:uncharacterized membrane protein
MADTMGNPALQPGESSSLSQATVMRDDRVFPETRWIGACIPPFLIVAFIMLYFFPNNTDTLFAWTIKPTMTPLMMGGGYISGSYFFVRLVMGGKWHWFTHGFPAIATFTWFMGLATFLHLEKFHPGHISFYAWLGLYVVTPFLVPILWLRNRVTDPHTPDPVDVVVPDWIRLASRVVGGGLLLIAVLMFIFPDGARSIWPWTLTPLTTRVVGGWFALPGVVGLMLSTDSRWSAWRILIQSQMIGLALILIAAARAWGDFNVSSPTAWLFVVGIGSLLLAVSALHTYMQARIRQPTTAPTS